MNPITWLLVGLIAGTGAKMITPQNEKGGWVSSLVVGILGSILGGFLASFVGISGNGIMAELIIAFVGAIVVLYLYHRYFADKLKNVM